MNNIGIFGASSLVGQCVLTQLSNTTNQQVFAFSRRPKKNKEKDNIHWLNIAEYQPTIAITHWLYLAPIWTLPEYFNLLEQSQVKRIIVLSSTSITGKKSSKNPKEIATIQQLQQGEQQLKTWANTQHVEYVILRPTLIYGLGQDKNISEIIRFIKRLHFFPLFGAAEGLRQPIHAREVTQAALRLININYKLKRSLYTISGGSTLSYREMVTQIFIALDKKPLFLPIPLSLFRLAISLLHRIPRYQHWSATMAERMNQNLIFDNKNACDDFNYQPQPFSLSDDDINIK